MYNNLPSLTESILWDERLLSADYAALSEDALRSALEDYLQGVNASRGEWHPRKHLSSACGLPATINWHFTALDYCLPNA
ncbi:hypothetical protein [Klebsiella pneumoniae]|uniref:hypothetical protein n=1 Tax=Klebsiella pneumoniae TaxID=573 RepID=UPI00292CA4F0|nr:hypothetical protein [Klebsiella pneumoniae]MDV0941893.1 hypothetical protein [Klebsiella pneumoniae]MDV1010152.1 hypothetical protein [Klebsiella pneumoniae]MDV1032383.1 hypothetical protein [Klebsiella pneumoniae]MDV1048983.1 hypothetical protein [Klebsiella pneumoniae]MDV1644411.1 hypothetical protein [Klebsiella pneumoniae]